jgi:hypothetical protein
VARIHESSAQLRATAPALASDIEREVDALADRRAFGLNFERHTPATKDQLSIYALGYEQLTGTNADRIQILNLDEQGKSSNDPVNPALVAAITARVDANADDIRDNHFVCTHGHSKESAYDDLEWLTRGGRAD